MDASRSGRNTSPETVPAPPQVRSHRRGLTLVELLVVVTVIAALLAMLLPALQGLREGARRVVCLNNLRNVGCALHGHLLVRRRFPAGCTEWKAAGQSSQRRCLAWSAMILPWLEEQPLADRIDFSRPFDHPANTGAASVPLAVFRCPSADRPELLVGGLGRCDYGGVSGERITSPNNPEKGALVTDAAFTVTQIGDGLTKTALVGECAAGPWPDGQWMNGRNLFDQAYAVNWPTWEDELRSRHPGGAHALFGDGAVRLIGDTTDTRILAAACTRAAGEGLPIPGEP